MPQTFGDVCREAKEAGYSVLWFQGIWDRKPPQPLTDTWIARMETNSATVADWELRDDRIVAVRRSDGAELFIYRAV